MRENILTPTEKSICIQLADIVTTEGTQVRAHINTDAVDEYANDMQDAANKFPPIVVFHDGSQYTLADGFHRVLAASRNGFKDILADVYQGTREDALRFALSANGQHGLRRTIADKRRSMDLALHQWPNLSDRELARMCAVSPSSVGSFRNQLSNLDSCNRQQERKGKDGKVRKLPERKRPEPERAEEPERPQVRTADEIRAESESTDKDLSSWHPKVSKEKALDRWYLRAKPDRRGRFLLGLFSSGKVSVPDKQSLRERFEFWLKEYVQEVPDRSREGAK